MSLIIIIITVVKFFLIFIIIIIITFSIPSMVNKIKIKATNKLEIKPTDFRVEVLKFLIRNSENSVLHSSTFCCGKCLPAEQQN